MSTLSKVFVVLVLLASVVFAMTSMARLKTTANYKQQFTDEQEARRQAVQDRDTAQANLKDEQDKHNETRTNLQSQVTDLTQQIDSLKAGKDAAEAELNNLKTTLETVGGDLASVKGELEKQREANERLRTELDAAVKRSAQDTEARLDAEQKLKDSQLRVKNLLEDVKNKEEQLTRAIAQATQLQNAIDAYKVRTGHDIAKPLAEQQVDISGVVTDVERKGSEVYVQLSVGSTSDVKVGTQFIIFGDVYKGDMIVERVFPDSSIGRLVSQGAKEAVRGDRATTKLRTGP